MTELRVFSVKTIESKFIIGKNYSSCIICKGNGIKCRQRESIFDTSNIPAGPHERVIYIDGEAKLRSKKGITYCPVFWDKMESGEMSREVREEVAKRKIITPL